MNLATANAAFSVARTAWDKFNEVREEKTREAYDALESAAQSVSEGIKDSDAFPRSRKEAGAVTKAAHARLERTLEELAARRDEAKEELTDRVAAARKEAAKSVKEAKKAGKTQVKAARKNAKKNAKLADKKLRKQAKVRAKALRKERKSKFWPVLGILTLLAAIGGAAYYFLRDVFVKETPSEHPPRVEEFGADKVDGSTLVYTSTSDTSQAAADLAEKDSDLVEEGVTERDEDLLGSIDEQLAKHSEDGAKHRLNEDDK